MHERSRPYRRLAGFASAFVLVCLTLGMGQASLIDLPDRLLASVEKRWGRPALTRLSVWQRLVRERRTAGVGSAPDAPNLQPVNGFFNQVPYFSDLEHWGVEDYWATPVEMLASFGGDCEDYAIGKYFSLKEIGVPISRLRITYVRTVNLNVSHMVLAYYKTPDAEPLILDNLVGDIRPASQRTDLVPVYSFNDDDLWFAQGGANLGGASNVRLWRDLLEKLAREQQV